MRIPNPYFRNVPIYGDLLMERVIVDYDNPLLSVLRDGDGSRYLCVCFDTRECQQWLVAPISCPDLARLLRNNLPLSAPYKDAPAEVIHVIMDYETRDENFRVMAPGDIPGEFLPREGEYLDADEGEWDDYILSLSKN